MCGRPALITATETQIYGRDVVDKVFSSSGCSAELRHRKQKLPAALKLLLTDANCSDRGRVHVSESALRTSHAAHVELLLLNSVC